MRFFIFLLFALSSHIVLAQNIKMFNEAIVDLADNRVEQAKEKLHKLYKNDSTNMNLAYLYGQSLVRSDEQLNYAIYLLEKASNSYTADYIKANYEERRVSEYVFYYLLMAYSKSGMCDLTLETLNTFYKIYSYENEWYLVKGQRWHLECEAQEKEIEEPTDSLVVENTPTKKKPVLVGTKPLQYTDKSAIYSVQVAAVLSPVFTYEFRDLKNIEVYVDENGVFRYSIGRFLFKEQAERLLEVIQDAGYDDAFIVNVKDKQRYSEEVVTIDHENVHKQLVGEVDFRVQVGAFDGDTIPADMMELYLKLDSINQVEFNGQSIITVGSFDNYDAAELYVEVIRESAGITDAFVTAWNYNRKVDVKQAVIYREEQEKAREEAEQSIEKRKNKKDD